MSLQLDEEEQTRGHGLRLKKKHILSQSLKITFLSQELVVHENGLSESVLMSPSLNCFNNRLARHYTNETRIGVLHKCTLIPG